MEEEETIQVTEEQIREVEHFWDDPKRVLALIDLLFLGEDPDKKKVCS